MSNETRMKEQENNLRTIYQELCYSYRAIDDFRAKLLGFLPLATGTGIFFLLADETKIAVAQKFFPPIGLFGFVVTLGLFFYELFGIRKCGSLIGAGIRLEASLGCGEHGQFINRPDVNKGPDKVALIAYNEPFAAGIIYPAVLAAWIYLALYRRLPQIAQWVVPILVFIVGFASTLFYDFKLRRKAVQSRAPK